MQLSTSEKILIYSSKINLSANELELINESLGKVDNWKQLAMSVYVLELHDLIIHTCVHIDKHFRGGNLSFRSFTDLVNLLEVHSSALNWEYLLSRCTLHSCTNTVMGYIVLVSEFYSVALPAAITNKYSSVVTKSDKKLFLHYLHGGKLQPSFVNSHSQNIANITGTQDKLRYLVEVVFPGKEFMVEKYYPQPLPPIAGQVAGSKKKSGIDSPLGVRGQFWWLWYPYRWWIGIKGVVVETWHAASRKV